MTNAWPIYEMCAGVTILIGVLVVIVLLFSLLVHRCFKIRISFVAIAVFFSAYMIWWWMDIVFFYTQGRASLAHRSLICMLVSAPNDYALPLVNLHLNANVTNYLFDVKHKYDSSYIIGIGDPENRYNILAPEETDCSFVFSFKDADGKFLLRENVPLHSFSKDHGEFDFEYDTFSKVKARENIKVQVTFYGPMERFLTKNPNASIYIRAAHL